MVVIKIFNVDCQNNEAPLTVLKSGEHILGRGCFPNCTHRKISRKHAILNVEENKATLTVVHVNPFFYISRASARVQILNKDVPVNLTDGDKFAFITDNWYKIQIVKEDSQDHPLNDGSTSTIPISVKDSSETVVASTSATVVSKAVSPLKRSLEELSSEGRKKLKTINQSLDELMKNIKQIESQDFPKNGSSETDNNKTFEMFRKKEVAESDDEDSDVETSDVTRDIEVVTSKEIGKLDCDKDVKSDSGEENNKDSDTEADLLKEPVIDKSNVPEGDLETNNLTTNREEVSDSDQDDTKEQEVKVPVDGNNLKEVDDNESSKQDQGNASTSTSGESMGKKLRREQCWYGASCYRKNPNHRESFSHPGDSDHDREPEEGDDDRPQCAYGAECYRTNQLHRREYKHPSARPAAKPATSRKKRRTARGPQMANDDSDSAEEDEEPYSADDSSSECFEEDDSDSDFSETADFDDEDGDEEVKLMFKEARKYLKRKRS